ncbi:MAG: alpha/beta hydrolase, partial [Acidobacteriota bacterium]
MRLNFWAKIIFVSLLIAAMFGCQNQTVSNSSNTINSNVSVNNSNNANQTNAEISAPRDIKFESADKVEIVGTFYESPKANSFAVLLLHQFGSDRNSFDEFAKRLQKKNFGVLAIDGRGFGESVKTTDGKSVEAQRTAEGVKGMEADV